MQNLNSNNENSQQVFFANNQRKNIKTYLQIYMFFFLSNYLLYYFYLIF